MQKKARTDSSLNPRHPFVWLLGALALVLIVLFHRSLLPDYVLASNDGPLGALSVDAISMPSAFRSVWYDLNSIGQNNGSFLLPVTGGLMWLLGPVGFAKIYVPLVLLLLGSSAWLFFRQLGLSPVACLLGGIAAALSSGPFSTACWGVGAQTVGISMAYLAMAAVVSTSARNIWSRLVQLALAGFAVGVGVMEAADVGALLSLMVAAFAFYHALISSGSAIQRVGRGVARGLILASFAGLIAVQTVTGLVGTQIKGVAGMQQDVETKAMRWREATLWSMPKRETLALFIPGLFGYRMDTPVNLPESLQKTFEGGAYWGNNGRDAAWDEYFANGAKGPPPRGAQVRQSGGGAYEGVLVWLFALWAVFQAFRRESLFNSTERKLIWFWAALALVALLLAFGRYAPFYQFVYQLPYVSTIRNPAKFLHYFNTAMVILFALGLNGVVRKYLEPSLAAAPTREGRFKAWWTKAAAFDKRWVIGCGIALVLSLLGWMVYSSSREGLVQYLQLVQFGADDAKNIARFSLRQVGWFIFLLAGSTGLMVLILSGAFAGARARLGAILLGSLLVLDMGLADMAWIVHWNYKIKYDINNPNPILEFLSQRPYEHRVAILPYEFPPEVANVGYLYRYEWAQHQFLARNIQSLDVVQMARKPQNLLAYEIVLSPIMARQWELSNTRYLIGPAAYVDAINEKLDPARHRFRIAARYDIAAKPGVGTPIRLEQIMPVLSPNGPYAVIEFTGALPRAKLFSNWGPPTVDAATVQSWVKAMEAALPKALAGVVPAFDAKEQATLYELASESFDPQRSVLVSDAIPASTSGAENQEPGTVAFTSYAPKDIKLQTKAAAPSVLLLNDKYDPDWKVLVDGKPAQLLRCNFIMRGVQVPAGEHAVEFVFDPPARFFYVSITAILLAIALLGVLLIPRRKEAAMAESPSAKPAANRNP